VVIVVLNVMILIVMVCYLVRLVTLAKIFKRREKINN